MDDLHDVIRSAILDCQRIVIASQNLHGVYLHHRDPAMRELQDIAIPRIDGMALVLLGRLLGHPIQREHRVTWVDWMDPLMAQAAEHGWRVFYLGGRPGVAERGSEILRARHPHLGIAAHHGYFDPEPTSEENTVVLEKISRFAPDILLVGMGMPRQERWILENKDKLDVPVILTCGAAMDYVAGVQATPPRWLGRLGLEWLYRLLCEPRRLAKRYLVEPWFLLGWLLRDLAARFRPGRAPAADGACAWHRDPASRSRRVPPMNGTSTGALPIEDVLEREQQGSWSR